MTATINASTSAGVVVTSDTSGSLALQTANTTAITIDTSQNVGIGVTPSAWSGFRALQIGGTTSIWSSTSGNGSSFYSNNIYYNGSSRIYTTTGYATEYIQDSSVGSHIWFTAPSGTVGGTVTTTERMRITSNGNVGIGTSSPASGISSTQTILEIANGNVAALSLNNTSAKKFTIYSSVSNSLSFYDVTAGADRMALDTSGNLLVGTTSSTGNGGKFQAKNAVNGAVAYFEVLNSTGGNQNALDITSATNASFNPIRFWVNGYGVTQVGSISCTTTTTSYNITSDYRLKEDIAPMTGALAKVARLKPVTYKWKSTPDEISEGFIAHELAEVCPQAVTGTKDAVDEDGKPVYQGIDTSHLIATLTASIQELSAKVTALEAKLGV